MKKFFLAIAIAAVAQFAVAQDTVCAPVEGAALWGCWPAEGGNITVTIGAEDIVTGGLEFAGTEGAGYLANGSTSTPFQFFVTGNDQADVDSVVLGQLGTVTLAAGSSTTYDITVDGGVAEGGVTAAWGMGVTPTSFPIAPIPEPASGLMAAFGLIGLLGLRRSR